jgi:hypothetical protein
MLKKILSAIIQCKTPDCARLKGSTTISGILPSFAFFQTIDNNRIIVGNAIVSTESSAVSTDDTQNFSDVIASNVGVVAAVVVAAVVVGSSGSGDDGDDDDKLSFTFNDIGLLNNDSVTNDNTIIVDGLKEGETWAYSTDGGATFH